MRRCAHCRTFHAGSPTFCAQCGRTFGVRICARGHHNSRHATFCADCGNAELSTPAPPQSFFSWLCGLALYLTGVLLVGAVVLGALVGVISSLDFDEIFSTIFPLILILGVLYWLMTLVPGPVKKVGKTMGRGAMRMIRGKRTRH
jgi:hypothetical protein